VKKLGIKEGLNIPPWRDDMDYEYCPQYSSQRSNSTTSNKHSLGSWLNEYLHILLIACWLIGMGILTCVPALAQAPAAGISASPTSIASGGSATLTWNTLNCVSADLNGTTVALNGSQVVSPTATTTYRITGHSSTGATDWGQVIVTVTGSTAPTAGITANPSSIASGSSSTLTWTSTNAVSATLNGAPVAVNGSQSVSPTSTTSYTFIATSSSGATATAQATVTVGSTGPTAGISANPTSITAGGSSTLTWTSTNAVSATLNGASVALNGSQAVSPTATTTYTFAATNAAGATASAQASVTVNPSGPPAAGISASPTSIASGGSATLTWNTLNCVSAD
jgi:ABC-type Na+ efflux pump permease subunit